MRVTAIKTRRVTAGKTMLDRFVDDHLPSLVDRSVVAITSKVVSLCENRVVPPGTATKADLVAAEAERYVATPGAHGAHFTIARGTLVPSAGIDESNGGGDYVLWPANPQATANQLRAQLRGRHRVKHVGVVITDSTCTPLRRGTVGICLAHSGFSAVNDYVGKRDLFGRPFQMSQANVAAGLAAAAVVVMGEGAERTPLCVIEDVPFVRFQARNPTAEELRYARISFDEDLFAPFLGSVTWQAGRNAHPLGSPDDKASS
jgi:dihydrofolate synthase / folylpolyglutamate synthase